MNSWNGTGRLTKDIELRYTADQKAVATMTMACDRFVNGEKQADFIRITAFGKTAENAEKFIKKGKYFGVTGSIKTGSYTNKDGQTVYTTDVIADRVDIIEWADRQEKQESFDVAPTGFTAIEDDIPF